MFRLDIQPTPSCEVRPGVVVFAHVVAEGTVGVDDFLGGRGFEDEECALILSAREAISDTCVGHIATAVCDC